MWENSHVSIPIEGDNECQADEEKKKTYHSGQHEPVLNSQQLRDGDADPKPEGDDDQGQRGPRPHESHDQRSAARVIRVDRRWKHGHPSVSHLCLCESLIVTAAAAEKQKNGFPSQHVKSDQYLGWKRCRGEKAPDNIQCGNRHLGLVNGGLNQPVERGKMKNVTTEGFGLTINEKGSWPPPSNNKHYIPLLALGGEGKSEAQASQTFSVGTRFWRRSFSPWDSIFNCRWVTQPAPEGDASDSCRHPPSTEIPFLQCLQVS